MKWKQLGSFVIAISTLANAAAGAPMMRITEWMYNGSGAGSTNEFVEFTNLDADPVNMSGWSFDDNGRAPGSQSLTGFGMVQPGQSVILTDLSASDFRTAWGLPASVVVVGGNANNLGRADEINLYDSADALVDRLTYDDQTIGGVRTSTKSGNPTSLAAVGANNALLWVLSANGDSYGSHVSAGVAPGDIGNPGTFGLQVPEPASLILVTIGLLIGMTRRRRDV